MEKRLTNLTTTKALGLALVLCLVMASCNTATLYQESQNIENAEWYIDSAYSFTVDVLDTQQPYDVELFLRHGGRYGFQNIWLFVDCTDPYGVVTRDTLNIYLADNRGRWLGSGVGSLYQISAPLKQDYMFPALGNYTYSVWQGMRYNPLEDVNDIGLKVIETKSK